MLTNVSTELNPYERAIELCKSKVKEATAAKLPKLAEQWKQELDKWLNAYRDYSLVTAR